MRGWKFYFTFTFRIDLCDPLEDLNIYATVPAFEKKSGHKIMVLAARVSCAFSFFDFAFVLFFAY